MNFNIINGNCLDVLKRLAQRGERFDCCVADPPYCSGGVTPSSIGRGGLGKYCDRTDLGSFSDGMTQRAFYRFSIVWLTLVRGLLKSPGYCFVFIDWRQLPVISDAFQAAEFYWRGVAVWNKGNCRPNPGQISQTAEFIVWGTADNYKSQRIVTQGVFDISAPKPEQRIHPTQKAVEVFERLYDVLPAGADSVIDPFCGSAAAGVAALKKGLNYTGIDESASYCDAARGRLESSLERYRATGEIVDAFRKRATLFASLEGEEET